MKLTVDYESNIGILYKGRKFQVLAIVPENSCCQYKYLICIDGGWGIGNSFWDDIELVGLLKSQGYQWLYKREGTLIDYKPPSPSDALDELNKFLQQYENN